MALNKKNVFATLICGAMMVLAGCERPVSGHYADEASATSYQFHGNGKATVIVLDTSVSAEYTTDNDKVVISSPQGTVMLTREGDRLYGPMGQELIRQPD